MEECLRVGNLRLTGEQIVSALSRYQMLEDLVRNLVLDSHLRKVALSEREVCAAIGEQEELASWIRRHQLTPAQVEARVLRPLRIERLKQNFNSQVEPLFLKRKAQLDQVEVSVLKSASHPLAVELYFRVRDDHADIDSLKQAYREQIEAKRTGPVPLNRFPEVIRPLLTTLRQGSVGKPVKVGENYWVIKLERYYGAQLTDELRIQLRDEIFNSWLQSVARPIFESEVELLSSTESGQNQGEAYANGRSHS